VRTEPSAPVVAHVVDVLLLVVALVVVLLPPLAVAGHTAIAVIAPLWKHASGYGTVKQKRKRTVTNDRSRPR
jgi:hypothetical protein